jgi:hypothetical protein
MSRNGEIGWVYQTRLGLREKLRVMSFLQAVWIDMFLLVGSQLNL